MDDKPDKIKTSLQIIKEKIAMKPSEPKSKTIKGINKKLIPTITYFLRQTNNLHLIGELKENLE